MSKISIYSKEDRDRLKIVQSKFSDIFSSNWDLNFENGHLIGTKNFKGPFLTFFGKNSELNGTFLARMWPL